MVNWVVIFCGLLWGMIAYIALSIDFMFDGSAVVDVGIIARVLIVPVGRACENFAQRRLYLMLKRRLPVVLWCDTCRASTSHVRVTVYGRGDDGRLIWWCLGSNEHFKAWVERANVIITNVGEAS